MSKEDKEAYALNFMDERNYTKYILAKNKELMRVMVLWILLLKVLLDKLNIKHLK